MFGQSDDWNMWDAVSGVNWVVDIYFQIADCLAMKERDPLLERVFRKCGNMSNLARKLNLSRQAVSKWDRVPLTHIKQVSEVTGLTREELRPDIYS